jgi:hypothetical protein
MREDLCRPLRPLLQRSDVFPSLSKLIDTTRIHLNIGLQNFELVAAAAAGAPPAAADELCLSASVASVSDASTGSALPEWYHAVPAMVRRTVRV